MPRDQKPYNGQAGNDVHLVSASILAIDLARHPSGAAVADVVDRILALTPAELAGLSGPAPSAARGRVLAQVPTVSVSLAEGLPVARDTAALLQVMSRTLVGTLDDLHDLLRSEEPLAGAPAEAVQVALDAVTAAWAGRHGALADVMALRTPWRDGIDPVPAALPETSYAPALRTLLDGVSGRSPEQWRLVVQAHGNRRGTLAWSTAMHEACHAAFEAGRLVDVARAQLAAARALRLSGASTGVDARAIAMATTAAVQAVCTADLLDGTALRSAWEAGV